MYNELPLNIRRTESFKEYGEKLGNIISGGSSHGASGAKPHQ